MHVNCGLYERKALSTDKVIRMVLPDPQPPSWTRLEDAACNTQWSPKDGKTVKSEPMPERPAKANPVDYLRAERSLAVEGPVPAEVFDARKAQCMGCPKRQQNPRDDIGFCGGCGCGQRDRARLTVKLTMPAVRCPMGKWGEANGSNSSPVRSFRAFAWGARAVLSGLIADVAAKIAPNFR